MKHRNTFVDFNAKFSALHRLMERYGFNEHTAEAKRQAVVFLREAAKQGEQARGWIEEQVKGGVTPELVYALELQGNDTIILDEHPDLLAMLKEALIEREALLKSDGGVF